jgi:hypothetical protein
MKATSSSNINPNQDKPASSKSFRTKENLNNALCDQTFKSLLRGDGTSIHNENRCTYVDPKVRKRRDQTSNIFNVNNPTTQTSPPSSSSDFPKPMFSARYVPSNVMFDDNYVEKNPQIRQVKRTRYEVENKLKNENNHLYSDELRLCPQRTKGMERKIEENFKRNPMEILSHEDNKHLNEIERKKVSKRTEAIKDYMGSEGVKKTFKSFKKDPYIGGEGVHKITNDDFDMVKRVKEIHKEEPNYGKRHFRVASCGNGAFTYMY